ncbi:MAG TPA: hypothetical protein VM348_07135 [Brevundimonas sp.]|nr:hypothetical protein [Brevundimonas sp.]
MAFSATDAAFEGFRLVRRNPLALVAWTLLYALLTLTTVFSLARVAGPMADLIVKAEALEGVTRPPPEQIMALMADFGVVMSQVLWLAPVSLVVGAMLSAAVARGVLKPSGDRFGYLRLGMDEVRVLAVTLVLGIVMGLAAVIGMAVLGVVFMAADAAGAGAIVRLIGFCAFLCAFVWASVRLSLAVPITVAEKRFAFFDSFGVTRGRFWPLLGMAVIVIVMVMVVQLLSVIVSLPLQVASGLEDWTFGAGQDAEVIMAAMDVTNPWVIGHAVVEAIVAALTVGILYAPFAAAYRDITGRAEQPSD